MTLILEIKNSTAAETESRRSPIYYKWTFLGYVSDNELSKIDGDKSIP